MKLLYKTKSTFTQPLYPGFMKQLLETQEKSKQRIQDREKELQKLGKAVETHKVCLELKKLFQVQLHCI
ncbi:tripartite motif-containing protein 29-like [Tachysurus ichikawai]